MCGICGIFNFNGQPISRDTLIEMNDSMALRGPDDSGIYQKGKIGMAMRRLSIIDLPGGHQPITNEDGSIHLILNGEIYNYIELRRDLEKLGHIFRTKSDVEVLIHLYEEYGVKAVEYLNGMFAFALWDENRESLWLGRDRLGIKPLVYASSDEKFSFASTLTALLKQLDFNRELDEESILLYMTLSYIPTPRSVWKNTHKLPPAHWMMGEKGKTVIQRYWSLEPENRRISHDEFIEEISLLFKDSIMLHGRSDVDVGTFLSGGLDSSAVTALFAQHTGYAVKTFSMDFEGKSENEGHFAQMVSDRYKTEHYAYSLGSEEAVSALDKVLAEMDEPMADSAIVPSYLLSKMARESGLKVMLSGAGGDELFGGYHRHYHSKRDVISGLLGWLPSAIGKLIYTMTPSRWQQYAFMSTNSQGLSYGLNTSGINLGTLKKILKTDNKFSDALELLNSQFSELPELEKKWGFSQARMVTDINHYLVDNVLAITDKTSMAASIEARVPLLDHRLVELAFSVLSEISLSNDFTDAKNSLKSMVKNSLPDSILSRSKLGFNGPVGPWLGEFKDKQFTDMLGDYVDSNKINEILSHSKNGQQRSENIFSIYVLNKWLQGVV